MSVFTSASNGCQAYMQLSSNDRHGLQLRVVIIRRKQNNAIIHLPHPPKLDAESCGRGCTVWSQTQQGETVMKGPLALVTDAIGDLLFYGLAEEATLIHHPPPIIYGILLAEALQSEEAIEYIPSKLQLEWRGMRRIRIVLHNGIMPQLVTRIRHLARPLSPLLSFSPDFVTFGRACM